MGLIETLTKRQERDGLTDGQMARKLSMSRPTWVRIRRGGYDSARRSPCLMRGVLSGFPELIPQALAFFSPQPEEAEEKMS